MKEYDVVVIGGGVGGLITACLLAKTSLKTLVIEKAQSLGGRCRSIEFAGCRVDCGVHIITHTTSKNPEDSYLIQALRSLGVDLKHKPVTWWLGLVGRKDQQKPEYLANPLKIESFFEFFSFMSGIELGAEEKGELSKFFDEFGDLSIDNCKTNLDIDLAQWIKENVKNPLSQAFFYGFGILSAVQPEEMSFGAFSYAMSRFKKLGGLTMFYPSEGTLEDTVVKPIAEALKKFGGEIRTNATARRVIIEENAVKGVWIRDNASNIHFDVNSSNVVCAFPIFESLKYGILKEENFTSAWLETIRGNAKFATTDLTGYYLLKKTVVPEDSYPWVHIFDASYGIPTYAGDYALGSFFGAKVHEGKQIIFSYIPGTLPATPFGLDPDRKQIHRAHERFKAAMEKMFPGFQNSIEKEAYALPGNWSRWYLTKAPIELGVKSPIVKGLYFSGDSVLPVGSLMTDHAAMSAMRCAGTIIDDLRTV